MIREGLNFGEAIEALKLGRRVSRKGWNDKGMFIFMRPACEVTAETASLFESLPWSVKNWMCATVRQDNKLTFTPYLCMKAADGTIVNGWLASQTDMLSEDWCDLDDTEEAHCPG